MRGLLSFTYGLAAYVVCQAVLLYYVAFSGNLFVSRSVDVGPSAPWPEAVFTDLLLLAMFGVQHSVMARRSFKRWWTRFVPPAVERSTYVVATCAVLIALFWFWIPITTPVLWRVEQPAGVAILWTLFGLGCVVAVVSTFLLDHFELFGLRQVSARMTNRTLPEASFNTPSLYRYVRHPLYLGFLMGLWAIPTMTAGRLLFALGLTAYILVGIAFEERDLLRLFGNRYRAYQEQVGMLFPRGRMPAQTKGNNSEPAKP